MLIFSQQTAYVANRCIIELGRPISDLPDVTEKFKTKGYLVTIDIEKALEKFGFETNFIDWIKIF